MAEALDPQTVSSRGAAQPRPRGASEIRPYRDLADYLRAYARENPETVALWCFGIGFVLGWKLKPW